MMRRGFFYGLILIWGVAGLAGCSEDQSEQCTRSNEGKFFYGTDPLLINPDSTANVVRTFTDVVFDSLIDFRNAPNPQLTYRFRTPNRLDIVVEYNGYEIPLVKGETYTVFVERTQRFTPAAMALMISDAQGIRYLGLNDWRPGSRIFKGGYPDLNGDGVLGVVFSDGGCTPRVENTECYQGITNYRLSFIVGTRSPLQLWNREQGEVGSWIFRVHKAELVQPKGCLEAILEANGVSFSVERSGLR